ncbi:thioesterase II family protein [Streptomyces sp. NPDC088923]|uniref:thioesterase II family protein n=1 Tax=Streptomyces sp. NPDC088923 TaxID=3365913 RepID=UPI003824F961
MLWTQAVEARPLAGRRLVCFPHAGGSPYLFRGWGGALDAVEVRAVCYPGRAERFGEPCASELTAMAREIARELLSADDARPVALFGHSMGATVAYEVARAVEGAGRAVDHLFVSGARAPRWHVADAAAAATWDDAAIIATLTELGGTDPELLDNPAFVDLVLPYIGADFRMLAAYGSDPAAAPLECPVTALVGAGDPRVTAKESADWREVTRGPFRHLTLPGGHFYLEDAPPYGIVGRALDVPRGAGSPRARASSFRGRGPGRVVPVHLRQPEGQVE